MMMVTVTVTVTVMVMMIRIYFDPRGTGGAGGFGRYLSSGELLLLPQAAAPGPKAVSRTHVISFHCLSLHYH